MPCECGNHVLQKVTIVEILGITMKRVSGQSVPEPSNDICVLDYFDYRKYITDKISELTLRNPRLSQRGLAVKAGFQSPHLLGMILNGTRRLSQDKLLALALPLKLTESEVAYLKLLVQIESAKNPAERDRFFEQIKTEFFSGNFTDIGGPGSQILGSWVYLVLRELVTVKGFSSDPKWLGNRLGISDQDAHAAFERLVELGFLREKDGMFEKANPSIHNFGKLPPAMVSQYNHQVLRLSENSLSRPKEKKYMETLNIAIPEKLVGVLKEQVKRFMREMDLLAESHDSRDEVWIVSVQLFAATGVGEN